MPARPTWPEPAERSAFQHLRLSAFQHFSPLVLPARRAPDQGRQRRRAGMFVFSRKSLDDSFEAMDSGDHMSRQDYRRLAGELSISPGCGPDFLETGPSGRVDSVVVEADIVRTYWVDHAALKHRMRNPPKSSADIFAERRTPPCPPITEHANSRANRAERGGHLIPKLYSRKNENWSGT